MGTRESTYRLHVLMSQYRWALMCVSDPASTPNLDSRGHCSLHGDMEERKSQWPSGASTVTHITAAHVTLKGSPVYSSWACWEWGWIAICAPAALPPSHHGANLVHSLRLRGWVIGRWQLSSEILLSGSYSTGSEWKCSKELLHWKDSPQNLILMLLGSSQHRKHQTTMVIPIFCWHLEGWGCHGDVKEGVTNVGHLSCWHQWDVSSNTLTNLKLWMCGVGDRVLKLQQ